MAVISLSRQVGSGGHEISQLVSKCLGYQLLDRRLMSKLGSDAGIIQVGQLVDLSAERHHVAGTFERGASMSAYNVLDIRAYEASGLGAEDRSAEMVNKILLLAYEKGNIVVEGRGGQGLLRNKPDVLQVRVIAPIQQRVEYLMKRDGISADLARQKVKEADKAQADYIRRYFDADIYDAALYDLIFNTAKLPLEAIANAICDAVPLITPAK
jgi:cytidylate kinase